MINHELKKIAQDVGLKLSQHDWKLATAESCTAGGISFVITDIPGSSVWFDRGFVTYSNMAKVDMLNVSSQTLSQFGSVSEETAREMAEGALQRSVADFTIAITGIAGPDGGTAEKPVGTVWIAYASKHVATQAFKHLFQGDRGSVRIQTITQALIRLLDFIK